MRHLSRDGRLKVCPTAKSLPRRGNGRIIVTMFAHSPRRVAVSHSLRLRLAGVVLTLFAMTTVGCKTNDKPDKAATDAASNVAYPTQTFTAQSAAEAEARIAERPDDVATRVELLWHYRGLIGDAAADRRAAEHVLWLIEHRPTAAVLATPVAPVLPYPDRATYERAAELWAKQAAAHPNDARVQGHAGLFFVVSDPARAIPLLENAHRLDADNPRWSDALAALYAERAASAEGEAKATWARRAIAMYRASLEHATGPLHRYYTHQGIVRAAWSALPGERRDAVAGLVAAAQSAAGEDDQPIMLHNAAVWRGLLALAEQSTDDAARILLDAGAKLRSVGSANARRVRLDELDLALASRLLGTNRHDEVRAYLADVVAATNDQGLAALLRDWTAGPPPAELIAFVKERAGNY